MPLADFDNVLDLHEACCRLDSDFVWRLPVGGVFSSFSKVAVCFVVVVWSIHTIILNRLSNTVVVHHMGVDGASGAVAVGLTRSIQERVFHSNPRTSTCLF